MKIQIPYGKKTISIHINQSFQMVTPTHVQTNNQESIIENALQNSYGSDSFYQFLKNSKKILFIVNDATRPTPTSIILEYLLPILKKHSQIFFLIATGTHREPTKQEYRYIFGKCYDVFKNNIYVHNAKKHKDMIYLGTSLNGTIISINKLVTEIKNVVVIGSVEPHYFAGYSGGRKSFLPGVASYKTIEMNHKLALCEGAQPLSLEKNPVHEDMNETLNYLKHINIFSIQTVLDSNHRIYAATTGDIHKSFNAAVSYANDIYRVCIPRKANIVLTVAAYPMDIDFYQSQKAVENAKHAVEKDGIIILVSPCREGVGNKTFLDVLSKVDHPTKISSILAQEYKLGYHKAAKMAQVCMSNQLWAVTNLDDTIVKKAFMKPYKNIQLALDDAIEKMEKNHKTPSIIIMPYGNITIPILKEKEAS